DYPWSSYRRNALGRHDPGITPHAHYLALDTEPDLRLQAYQSLFKDALDQADADALRAHTRPNQAFGNQRSPSRLEASSVAASSSGRAVGPPQRRENVPDPFFPLFLTSFGHINAVPGTIFPLASFQLFKQDPPAFGRPVGDQRGAHHIVHHQGRRAV